MGAHLIRNPHTGAAVVLLPSTPVAVAPTLTTLADVQVQPAQRISIQIDNLDAAQTFTGAVKRRLSSAQAFAYMSIADFSTILPLTSAAADVDVQGGATELVVEGTASGAGLNVQVIVLGYQ